MGSSQRYMKFRNVKVSMANSVENVIHSDVVVAELYAALFKEIKCAENTSFT